MRLKWEDWPQHLNQSQPLSAYLIFGEEVLLVQEAIAALIARVRQQGFDEIERFVLEPHFNWEAVQQSAESLSLFANRKLILLIVPNAELLNEAAHQSLRTLMGFLNADQILAIQVFGKLDKKQQAKPWVKHLEQQGALLPIWPLNRQRLPAWVKQRAEHLNLQLSPQAVQAVVQQTEGNLLASAQTLAKVAIHHQGFCDLEQLEGNLVDHQRFDVFALAEACIEGQLPRAFSILRVLRWEGVEPTLVLWALNREIRLLYELRYRSQSEWQKVGVWPRRQRFYQAALQRTTTECLETLLQQVAQLDNLIKDPQHNDQTPYIHMAFSHLVLALTQQPMPATHTFWRSLDSEPIT